MRTRQIIAALIATGMAAHSYSQETVPPSEGFVPNAVVAAKIAEVVAGPIFGADVVASELPLKAELKGDVWHIEGADHSPEAFGGVLEIHISRKDGRIIHVSHGE